MAYRRKTTTQGNQRITTTQSSDGHIRQTISSKTKSPYKVSMSYKTDGSGQRMTETWNKGGWITRKSRKVSRLGATKSTRAKSKPFFGSRKRSRRSRRSRSSSMSTLDWIIVLLIAIWIISSIA